MPAAFIETLEGIELLEMKVKFTYVNNFLLKVWCLLYKWIELHVKMKCHVTNKIRISGSIYN